MVPYKSFGVREYNKAINTATHTLQRSTRGPKLGLFQRYDLYVKIAMKELTPSPTGEYQFHLIDDDVVRRRAIYYARPLYIASTSTSRLDEKIAPIEAEPTV